jgi:hypothetical protein
VEKEIGRLEKNDYTQRCAVDGTLMHFLEEVTDTMAAYYCGLCGKVRMAPYDGGTVNA